MLIQFQLQHLTICKLKLELLAIECRIVLVNDAVVVRTDDNDVCGVVVLRMGKVVDVMSLDNAVAILIPNFLTTNLVTIVREPLQFQDDATVYLAILHKLRSLLNRS